MHEGGWGLSCITFRLCSGTWCPKTKKQGRRDFVHQVGAGHGRRNAQDLVQRKRKNKDRRDFVHQVGAGHGRRNARDLVQRKRKNKG